MKTLYVYKLTNSKLKPIYVGVTNNCEKLLKNWKHYWKLDLAKEINPLLKTFQTIQPF
jgi:predicted GIY-YIG superfamily endonuclease